MLKMNCLSKHLDQITKLPDYQIIKSNSREKSLILENLQQPGNGCFQVFSAYDFV